MNKFLPNVGIIQQTVVSVTSAVKFWRLFDRYTVKLFVCVITSAHNIVGWLQTIFCYLKCNAYDSIKYLKFLDPPVRLISSVVRSKCLIRWGRKLNHNHDIKTNEQRTVLFGPCLLLRPRVMRKMAIGALPLYCCYISLRIPFNKFHLALSACY
jgi:hypothetical protein